MQIQIPALVDAIETRSSTNFFQPDSALEDAAILRLVELATRAPTAFNLQNWRFLAVRSPQEKARLQALAAGQAKVSEAAVTFILCGLHPRQGSLPPLLAPSVEAGYMPAALAADLASAADAFYGDNLRLSRDEAIRSASLAGAFLMIAAQAHGLGACPMVGFDADAVAQAFGLAQDEVPVMLVAVGRTAAGNWPQKPRLAPASVATLL
ncbi:nitroreductase family protein [Microvirga tunisiensis]|uniref:Nitroreductase family protein n=2 Tax=Pannonibacter tanglangensis TaxID=2750084 RepID=A0A7X5F4C3_9HYPH|nr:MULTISPECIES: nitroreductase family protein [unclassified Pannonibacter]NBN65032.1 nitroreductase family protein [Pannonibacter sp. XCT-34]NBN79541.1 nitroreductase family protein [Pannonibacter sp. XCT-53]